MPIHGHTKIELTNQTTGEVEVVEKDNLVTNAVAQIFTSFNGGANLRMANANGEYTGWELPESLYGGLLLYDRALGSDPDTVFAPPEARLVGTGVPRMSNTGNGVLRGSYNKIESNIDVKKRRGDVCLRLCHQPGQRGDRLGLLNAPLRRLL